MTTELAPRDPTPPPSVDRNRRMANSLRGLLAEPVSTPEQAKKIREVCRELRQPAKEAWTLERIFTLLTHYYVSDLPEQVAVRIADDWFSVLDGLPDWAIERACRWWLSADNPKRRNKPMPGDIEASARGEVALLDMAEGLVKRGGASIADNEALNAARMMRGEAVPDYLTFGDGARTMLRHGVPQEVIDRYAKGSGA